MSINLENWGFAFRIPINYTPAETTTGQMLVLTEAVIEKLPTTEQNHFWENVSNGGGDLRLCENLDGTGQVPLQVVLCDTVSRKLIIWLRLPEFDVGSLFYLFFKNSSASILPLSHDYGQYATWQDFSFVSHNGVDDVTGNLTLDQVGTLTPSTGVFGDVSGSIDLDVTTEAYLQGSITPRNGGEDSFRTWSKRRNADSEGATVGIFVSSSSGEYRNTFIRAVDSDQMEANSVSAWKRQEHSVFGYAAATGGGVSTYGVWERLVTTFSMTQRQVFLNDAYYAENDAVSESTKDYDRFAIGGLRDRTPGGYFDGQLSEIWWERAIPSEAKIYTEYENQSDNANFYGTPVLVNLNTQLLLELDTVPFELSLESGVVIYPLRRNRVVLKLRALLDTDLSTTSEGYVDFSAEQSRMDNIEVRLASDSESFTISLDRGEIEAIGTSLICDFSALPLTKYLEGYTPSLVLYVEGDQSGLVITSPEDFVNGSLPAMLMLKGTTPSTAALTETQKAFSDVPFKLWVETGRNIYLGRANRTTLRLEALADTLLATDEGYLIFDNPDNNIDKIEVLLFSTQGSLVSSSVNGQVILDNTKIHCYWDAEDFNAEGEYYLGVVIYSDGDIQGVVVGNTALQTLGLFSVYPDLTNPASNVIYSNPVLEDAQATEFELISDPVLWGYPNRTNISTLKLRVNTSSGLITDDEDYLDFTDPLNDITRVELVSFSEGLSSIIDSSGSDLTLSGSELSYRAGGFDKLSSGSNWDIAIVVYFGSDPRGLVIYNSAISNPRPLAVISHLMGVIESYSGSQPNKLQDYHLSKFDLVIEGDKTIYPQRSNRTAFRLKPNTANFELDSQGYLILNSGANQITNIELCLYNWKQSVSLDLTNENLSLSGSQLICNLGQTTLNTYSGAYYIGVVLYIGADPRGYVAFTSAQDVSKVIEMSNQRI